MSKIFLSILKVVPTSPLTLRRVPLSHKRIGSYGFVPPTTFSGYVLRVFRLSKEEGLPREKIFKNERPSLKDYHILELSNIKPTPCSLGAYPELKSRFTSLRMAYQTIVKGHGLADGIDIFDPTVEELCELVEQCIRKGALAARDKEKVQEQLEASKNNALYIRSVHRRLLLGVNHIPTWLSFKRESRRQPLYWEFLVSPRLTGYIVASSRKILVDFRCVKNYGYKIGKEGFAYIENVEGPYELYKESGVFMSSVIFPAGSNEIDLLEAPRLENLYYLDFAQERFKRGLFALPGSKGRGEYYKTQTENDTNYVIPKESLEIFSGGILG